MKLQQIVLITLSAVTNCFGATVTDIQTDVNSLTGNMTTFTGALSSFDPNSFPISAIPLVPAVQGLLTSLNQSITDAQALNHPVKNVTGLIAVVTPLSTTIPQTLTAIVNAKPQFEVNPTYGGIVDGAVGGVLISLQKLSQEFISAAIAALPAGQKAALNDTQSTINAAFTSAIDTFGVCSS